MPQLAIGIVTLVWRLVVAGAVIAARWTLGGFIPRGPATTDSDAPRPGRSSRHPIFPNHGAR